VDNETARDVMEFPMKTREIASYEQHHSTPRRRSRHARIMHEIAGERNGSAAGKLRARMRTRGEYAREITPSRRLIVARREPFAIERRECPLLGTTFG